VTSPDFRVRRRWVGPIIIIRPEGDLDLDTAATLAAQATAALRRSRLVVVDLSAVTFLDCHAVGVLVDLAQQARHRGGRLQMADLPEHAHQLFSIFDLYGVLGGRNDVATECRACLHHLATAHREALKVTA